MTHLEIQKHSSVRIYQGVDLGKLSNLRVAEMVEEALKRGWKACQCMKHVESQGSQGSFGGERGNP